MKNVKKYNLILVGILAVVVIGVIYFFQNFLADSDDKKVVSKKEEINISNFEITAEELLEKIDKMEEIVVLDVRTKEEYDEGHIKNSILLPLQNLDEESLKEKGIGKDDSVVVYCRSGNRSRQAYEKLKSLGYKNVKDMSGGILEWKSKNFPLVMSDDKNLENFETKNFSEYSSLYKFNGEIPANFEVEYVKNIESINVYDPEDSHESNIDKSKIFVRYFRASDFLTLQTVSILQKEKTKVGAHDAVRYEIEKKEGVTDFPSQPFWRNEKHKLIDIRYDQKSPTFFYVFSYSPDFPEEKFERFIKSLDFQL